MLEVVVFWFWGLGWFFFFPSFPKCHFSTGMKMSLSQQSLPQLAARAGRRLRGAAGAVRLPARAAKALPRAVAPLRRFVSRPFPSKLNPSVQGGGKV